MLGFLVILSLITLVGVVLIAGLLAVLVDHRHVAVEAARLRAEDQIDSITRATLQAMRDAARQVL